ncbi:MIP/aquaporin family protein [Actinomycetaceae bacterium MB13-C1-2]|nr:MIP/aquaporin family protein [Actinomycetaceae bacterium MB13-C1-2]
MWNLWDVFASEFLGTAILLLLGTGVVATNLLPSSKGRGSGWLLVTWGWGLGVFVGVYAAWKTGGHLNPAVTIAKAFAYLFDPEVTLNGAAVGTETAIPVTAGNIAVYIVAQMLGAFMGAVLCYLTFKKQFDQVAPADEKLGVFATGPAIRSYGWNLVTEIIATAVLIGFVMVAGGTPTSVGPLAVALVIVGIGASLGGPTGFALNPARDLGARVAHAVLPIKGKGGSDWSYSWVPIVGPIIGALLAVLLVYGFGLGSIDIRAALPL